MNFFTHPGSEVERLSHRSTEEVFDDHLALVAAGDHAADLARNYADDSVVLTSVGVFRGRRGARNIEEWIHQRIPFGELEYVNRLVSGEVAFLEWHARSPHVVVDGGADSFLIRHGRILVQTVHFMVVDR